MLPKQHLCISIIWIFFCVVGHSQSQCDLIKGYSMAVCGNDTTKALADLERFRQLFPSDSLIENINFALSDFYYRKGDIQKAKQVATEIVSTKKTVSLGNFNMCPIFYDSVKCQRQIFFFSDFKELQYDASMILYAVFFAERNYDSALYCLTKAESEFYCRRYLPSDCRKNLLLKYSITYENKNDYDKAINVLVPYILSEQITDRLLFLLNKYKNLELIKEAYRNIEDSLTIEYGVVSENPKVRYEQDEYGRILRTISVEEYGRKVYWHFLGQKFLISGANDYQSHRVKGESKKRKLEAIKTDDQIIEAAKNWIQKNTIYKLLYN